MSFPPPTERQARTIWVALSGLAIAVIVGLVVLTVIGLGWVIRVLSPVLWPLAIAGVLAYLLDPVVDVLERRGLPRTRAIIAVFVLGVLMVIALFGSVVPQIVRESRQLISVVPVRVASLEVQVRHWISHPPPWANRFLTPRQLPPAPEEISNPPSGDTNTVPAVTPPPAPAPAPTIGPEDLKKITAWITNQLPNIGRWLFGQVGRVAGWLGVLAGLFLIPVYLFYFLLEKQGISSRWTDYLPVADSNFKEELVFVLQSINSYLITFFRGQVLVAICDGVLYTIGFLAVGLPYSVLLGVAAILLTMIPFIGAMVTCAAALAIAIVQYGDLLHPVLVLAVFGLVQALEGLVISPKIMGDRVGLHPLTIIVAVMAGTTLLGGILGGILAIPLTAALRVMMFRYVWKHRAPALEEGALTGR